MSNSKYLTKEELKERILEIKAKQENIKKQQSALKEAAINEINLMNEAKSNYKDEENIKHRLHLEKELNEKEEIAEKVEEKIRLKEEIEELRRRKEEESKKKQHDLEMQRIKRQNEQNERLEMIRQALMRKKREKELMDLEKKKLEKAKKLNVEIKEKEENIEADVVSGDSGKKPIVYVISGPTAVGKSQIAMMLAKHVNGEIVNCDSVQIYKHFDIGSAKPSKDDMRKVPHHLYDFADPKNPLTVAEYQKMALNTIDDIISRNKTPIICGGTGLYLNSILYQMDFATNSSNMNRRKELSELAKTNGSNYLYEHLAAIDNEAASRIHPNNTRKIIRAIEAFELGSGIKPINDCKKNTKYDFKLFGITMDREWLYERINKRTLKIVKNGLINEVKKLKEMEISPDLPAMKAIGYKEIYSYLENETSLKEAITNVMKNTRHYAKRQLTWLKRYDDIKWIEINKGDRLSSIVLKIINEASIDGKEINTKERI